MFVYQDYLYEATSDWKDETSQRFCKKLAFFMNDEWHHTHGGDWFNWYATVRLAKIKVELL